MFLMDDKKGRNTSIHHAGDDLGSMLLTDHCPVREKHNCCSIRERLSSDVPSHHRIPLRGRYAGQSGIQWDDGIDDD